MFIIYTLKDPFTNEIRYVGKTTDKNFNNRLKSHRNPHIRADKNQHKLNWLKSIKQKGGLPIMEVLDTTDNDWQLLEQYWISQFKAWGFKLVNYSDGGDNPPIRKQQKESTKKLLRDMKPKRTLKVIDYNTKKVIGVYEGVNMFINKYFGLDRYKDKKEFNIWSSKISSIALKRTNKDKRGNHYPRKSHKGLTFEYLDEH